MKEKLFIFGALGLLIALLVGLNAASYVQKEKIPDSEGNPNRSTYNSGPTGTRAFYDLLSSTGHSVGRWEKPISELNREDPTDVSTFVIVGATRREILDDEMSQLLEWVEWGGKLVIIDRTPPVGLLETTVNWKISISESDPAMSAGELEVLLPTVDPSNQTQMTDGAQALRSLQPTPFTLGVNAVQPSKFATSIVVNKTEASDTSEMDDEKDAPSADSSAVLSPESVMVENPQSKSVPSNNGEFEPAVGNNASENADTFEPGEYEGSESNSAPATSTGIGPGTGPIPPPPPRIQAPVGTGTEVGDPAGEYTTVAPVEHFGNDSKKVVVDFPYGYGSIAVISDPYIIANGGVNLVDNAPMAINVVSSNGLIVFDEYHQGYGSNQNRLLAYFYGTPVFPVFLQISLVIGLGMLSLSRRFARPLPLDEPSRISKLEYVGAMAQLKQRTRAFDLAIENIYTDFRRRVSRLVGVDNHHTPNKQLADAIVSRTKYGADEILEVMKKCEDIMHGEKTGPKEVLALTTKIREIESSLGLRRGRTIFRK